MSTLQYCDWKLENRKTHCKVAAACRIIVIMFTYFDPFCVVRLPCPYLGVVPSTTRVVEEQREQNTTNLHCDGQICDETMINNVRENVASDQMCVDLQWQRLAPLLLPERRAVGPHAHRL